MRLAQIDGSTRPSPDHPVLQDGVALVEPDATDAHISASVHPPAGDASSSAVSLARVRTGT